MGGQGEFRGSPITSGRRCKSSRTHPFPNCPALRCHPREIKPPNIPRVPAFHGAASQNSRQEKSERAFCHQSIPDSSTVPAAVFKPCATHWPSIPATQSKPEEGLVFIKMFYIFYNPSASWTAALSGQLYASSKHHLKMKGPHLIRLFK